MYCSHFRTIIFFYTSYIGRGYTVYIKLIRLISSTIIGFILSYMTFPILYIEEYPVIKNNINESFWSYLPLEIGICEAFTSFIITLKLIYLPLKYNYI